MIKKTSAAGAPPRTTPGKLNSTSRRL